MIKIEVRKERKSRERTMKEEESLEEEGRLNETKIDRREEKKGRSEVKAGKENDGREKRQTCQLFCLQHATIFEFGDGDQTLEEDLSPLSSSSPVRH